MTLAHDQFPAFFEALWGHEPFPWQTRLLRTVVADGWPRALDLPTGSGKTSVLDIACFALALDAEPPHPRRIVLVIDRRVVVDQAFERAVSVCRKLRDADSGVLWEVAQALRKLHSGHGGPAPITAAALRGGTMRDEDWARAPDQPCFLISTVDQIGSRLLFRGYGVSRGMAPVHAGLLGRDCLYLLDEVHLSRPFAQTLEAIVEYGACELVEREIPRPLVAVHMSATMPAQTTPPFALDPNLDFPNESSDAPTRELRRRLSASKPAKLDPPVTVPAKPREACRKIAHACVAAAWNHFERDACDVGAIIVNRVDTARDAAAFARDHKKFQKLGVQVHLLTGRMRPLDRAELERGLFARLADRAQRVAGEKLLVVSTQAIEAGADFDFDALVTECSSIDSLRQRFGRLDRRGALEGRARATILIGSRDAQSSDDDPVYGPALAATWGWLQQQSGDGTIDFGILAQRDQPPPTDDLRAPSPSAPALLPAYLDLWIQTSPRPAVEPDVPIFLHGPDRGSPDVQLVWRADLPALDEGDHAVTELAVQTILEAVPPSSLEALSVPVWTARAFLAALANTDLPTDPHPIADVEGESSSGRASDDDPNDVAPAILWSGRRAQLVRDRNSIVPGATLVIPTVYGGIAHANWDPDARDQVRDRGDEAQLVHRGRPSIRWGIVQLPDGCPRPNVTESDVEDHGARATTVVIAQWASETLERYEEKLDSWLRISLEAIRDRPIATVEVRGTERAGEHADERVTWRATRTRQRLPLATLRQIHNRDLDPPADATSADDGGSFTSVEVELDKHLVGVRDCAYAFAHHLGLPDTLGSDLALAGHLHDLGKADPRFQTMLLAGDEVRAAMSTVLFAKSKWIAAFDRPARERARLRAGYPTRARHELMSVALVENQDDLRARAHDWDLVLHLVASHHGYCRPMPPAVSDTKPVDVVVSFEGRERRARSDHELAHLGSGVVERFWRLVARYGWHGLTYLEAVLRLADHRRSEAEARDKGGNL